MTITLFHRSGNGVLWGILLEILGGILLGILGGVLWGTLRGVLLGSPPVHLRGILHLRILQGSPPDRFTAALLSTPPLTQGVACLPPLRHRPTFTHTPPIRGLMSNIHGFEAAPFKTLQKPLEDPPGDPPEDPPDPQAQNDKNPAQNPITPP